MMKIAFWSVCLALSFTSPQQLYAQLQDAVQAFDEGNTHYKDGNYAGAITSYQAAIEKGYSSGELYYNLGNAYFRNDQLGQAIRYYEKAKQFIPESQELLHNLNFAREQTIDQFSQLPVPWWIQWWQTNSVLSGGRWLLWIGVIFYVAGISIIVYRVRTRSRNPWLRRSLTIALVVAGFFLLAAFAASVQSERRERAVVVVESLQLMENPSAETPSEIRIHEGLVVDILQENTGWIEIRLPNGARGWVQRTDVADV